MHKLLIVPVALALLTACGGGETTPEAPACDVSLGRLAGKTFVWIEDAPGKKGPNPMARMLFVDEGGTLHAKYTAKSGTRVYDYTCTPKDGTQPSLECEAKPDLKRACMAFEVLGEGQCTPEALEGVGLKGEPAEVAKVVEDVRKLVGEARKNEQWETFAMVANNIGNKLQGKLTIRADEASCRLKVDDRYVAVYNGQRSLEDNPVGHADFEPTAETFLFEDCKPETTLVDLDVDTMPEDVSTISPVREHPTGQPVHYHILSPKLDDDKAEEGCTYSVDTWANGRPDLKDQAIEIKDGYVLWHVPHTWQPADLVLLGKEDGADVMGAMLHMKRKKVCGGAGSVIDIACNMTRLVPGTGEIAGEVPAAQPQ
jgi:hypothetical protein